MPVVIAIPRGLFYYKYQGLWQSFFDGLGVFTVYSPPTDRRVMELGLKYCVNEACLPVKAYFGHTAALREQADYLFVPRYLSVRKGEHVCPKLNGLPDMIRNGIPGLPPLLASEINLIKKDKAIYDTLDGLARTLGLDKRQVRKAYSAALAEYRKGLPIAAPAGLTDGRGEKLNILLLGHPYLVYDAYLNLNIKEKLASLGGRVLTLEMYDQRTLRLKAARLEKRMFWSYGADALGLLYHLLEVGGVDGIVSLSSFGCGVDSFVGFLAERRVKKGAAIPYLTVTLDEHAAEAGLDTRIEAFMDTVKRRKNADNLSPSGQSLYRSEDIFGRAGAFLCDAALCRSGYPQIGSQICSGKRLPALKDHER